MPSILETWKLLSLNKFYVLNLIISGMPSILKTGELSLKIQRVLNLIISGMPSIHKFGKDSKTLQWVLNLIISGMPSIHRRVPYSWVPSSSCFKPYYKWNAFNTLDFARVLNSWLFSSFFNPRNI